MKAACVYKGVIGHQYMPPGSCCWGCGRGCWDQLPALMSYTTSSPYSLPFHLLHRRQEGRGSPVSDHSLLQFFLVLFKAHIVNLSRWVFWTPCSCIDPNMFDFFPPHVLSGHKRWSLRAGHGRQDWCHGWLPLQGQVGWRAVPSTFRQGGLSRGEGGAQRID